MLYSLAKLVTNSSGRPSPSTSSASTPIPDWAIAVDIVGGARDLGDVVERAVAAVQEQEIRVHVVGDEDVDQAVVVDVGRHHAEAVAVVARLGRRTFVLVLVAGSSISCSSVITLSIDVGERAIAVVVVEQVLDGLDRPRRRVEPDLLLGVADPVMVFGIIPAAVVGHVDVEVSVVVVIEHGAAGRPVGCVDAGRLADVLERAVAVIEVQDVRAVVAQEDVLVAVVVDVAGDDAVAEAAEAEPGRLGHVLEMVAAQVLVEPVRALFGGAQRQERGGGEVDVEQAVVVVVEDGHARAVGRGEVLLVGHARKVHEVDARLPWRSRRNGTGSTRSAC